MAQVRRQRLFKPEGGGELPQIKLLQDLTVTAATYSHDASFQKSMNTLSVKVIQIHVTIKSECRIFLLLIK